MSAPVRAGTHLPRGTARLAPPGSASREHPLCATDNSPDLKHPHPLKNTLNTRLPRQRYHPASIALHWGMLVLLMAVYTTIELKGLFPKGSDPRQAMKAVHTMLGLAVLALVPLRIGFRLTGRRPRIVPEPSNVQKIASRVMHASLYIFMLVMPLAGWLHLSAQGLPIGFLGLELPALMGPDPHAADLIEDVHGALGTAGYYFIAVHAMAGLFHHMIVKDNTLVRMLPLRVARFVAKTHES